MREISFFVMGAIFAIFIFVNIYVPKWKYNELKQENKELKSGVYKKKWDITINGVTHHFDENQKYIGTDHVEL